MVVQPHDHEFVEPTREIVEDGAWIVEYDCSHVEILGSQTCDRLDETFYEEGASCEAYKHVRLDVSRLEKVVMGENNVVATGDSVLLEDEIDDVLAEELEATIVNELGIDFQPHDVHMKHSSGAIEMVDASEQSRVVDVRLNDNFHEKHDMDGTYRVFYDNPEVTVHEY